MCITEVHFQVALKSSEMYLELDQSCFDFSICTSRERLVYKLLHYDKQDPRIFTCISFFKDKVKYHFLSAYTLEMSFMSASVKVSHMTQNMA